MSLTSLGDGELGVFHTGITGADPDALVVRPDGHIVAALHSDRDGVASLRRALGAVGVILREGASA
jgi:hypothetical protein